MNKQLQRLEIFWRRMCRGPFPFPLSEASGGLITPSTVHHWNSSRNTGNGSLNQVTNKIKPRFCSHFKQWAVRRMPQCEGKRAQFWCALLRLLFSGTVQELFTQGWSSSAVGVGQPGLILETSGPSSQWECANGLPPGGCELPETLLRMGKRQGFHPRAQGQSWRGKKWGKKLCWAADTYKSAFSMSWGARPGGVSLANPPSPQAAQDTLKALVWAWGIDAAPGTGVQWNMNSRGSDKGQGCSHLTEKSIFTDYSSVSAGVTCGNTPG